VLTVCANGSLKHILSNLVRAVQLSFTEPTLIKNGSRTETLGESNQLQTEYKNNYFHSDAKFLKTEPTK
jgi:hypothetical protein